MKVWCLATIAKEFLPFSKDHSLSHWYATKNSFPRAIDLLNCWVERKDSAPHHRLTNFSKLEAAWSIFSSLCSAVPWNIFSKTGTKAGNKCLPSPALQSRDALLAQGLAASVNMESFRLVSLCSNSCSLYCHWISSNIKASLSQGFLTVTLPGPSW